MDSGHFTRPKWVLGRGKILNDGIKEKIANSLNYFFMPDWKCKWVKQAPLMAWRQCKVHGLPKGGSCYPTAMDSCHMESTRFGRSSDVCGKDRNSYFNVNSLSFLNVDFNNTKMSLWAEAKKLESSSLFSEQKEQHLTLDLPHPSHFNQSP